MKTNIMISSGIGEGIKGSLLIPFIFTATMLLLFSTSCKKDETADDTPEPVVTDKYTIEQTLSDEAQKNTIAFDALAFMTGSLGAQTFLPPGKVADYSGFQYLRDNDPTNLGHNTSFVTIIAFNILDLLNEQQMQMFADAASEQVLLINEYAYRRYPLCKAFRRLIDGDLPSGTTGLNAEEVRSYSAELYRLDGEISYKRAQLFGQVIGSMSAEQLSKLASLKALKGIGNWDSTIVNPLENLHLEKDVNVAVMTFASEMYAWYAGSTTADVYFCPERQGTYFGSFYLKDWPAMGNPNFTINEQLTASAGQDFLNILTPDQSTMISGIVGTEKQSLQSIVSSRESISAELRKFLQNGTADQSLVYSLSEEYGRADGEIIYQMASTFAQVFSLLNANQKAQLEELANELGYMNPPGSFLYSEPIPMPSIENTDHFFN